MGVVDIGALIDRQKIRPFTIQLVCLCLLAVIADGYDLQAVAYAGPSLVREWHITRAALGPVFSASLAGLLFGSPLFGYLGDRHGRKASIIAGCVIYGVFSLITMAAHSVGELIALRFAVGVGLGGVLPNVIALIAEYVPKRMRAAFIILVFFGMPIGGALPGPIAAWLMPHFGWPILFFVGGVGPLLVALLLFALLPESIKFLALDPSRRGEVARLLARLDPAVSIGAETRLVTASETKSPGWSPAVLFDNGLAVITPLLWFAFTANLMVNFFINSWMPTLFQGVGLSVEQAALITSMYFVGGIFGSAAMMFLVDRFGMVPIAILFALGVPSVAFIGTPGLSVGILSALGFAAGFCVIGNQNSLNAAVGMVYPTACRSKGGGWALAMGRFGSIAGPLLGGLLVGMHVSLRHLFYAPAVPLALGTLACFLLVRLCLGRFRGHQIDERAAST